MTVAKMGPSAGDVAGGWSPADEGTPFGGNAAAIGGAQSAARQLDMLSLPPDTPRVRRTIGLVLSESDEQCKHSGRLSAHYTAEPLRQK